MKRIWIAGLVGTLALTSLCGCTDLAKQINESVTYPQEYYIEYQVTNEDNTVTYTAKGKDSEGNYYYKSATAEYFFEYTQNAYDVHEKTNGVWAKTISATEAYIKEQTKAFNDYAEKSKETFNGNFKEGEKTAFLERSVNTYTLELKIFNFKPSYSMYVDEETGICLQYKDITTVGDTQTGKTGFECISFQTSDVDILQYFTQE